LKFVIALADRLKIPIEKVLQLSTLELNLWAGYMLYEHNESKSQNVMGNNVRTPAIPRRRK